LCKVFKADGLSLDFRRNRSAKLWLTQEARRVPGLLFTSLSIVGNRWEAFGAFSWFILKAKVAWFVWDTDFRADGGDLTGIWIGQELILVEGRTDSHGRGGRDASFNEDASPQVESFCPVEHELAEL